MIAISIPVLRTNDPVLIAIKKDLKCLEFLPGFKNLKEQNPTFRFETCLIPRYDRIRRTRP